MPLPRRLRRRERALGALIAAQLLAATATAISSPGALRADIAQASVVNARPSVPSLDRASAVRELLAERSRAVLDRDRTAFLATVDPAASPFRRRQAALFDALAGVPLSRWEYLLEPRREQSGRADLDARYGTWWAPEVSLRYAFTGYDATPTLLTQGFTFVQRGPKWFVAADADFPQRRTAHELWDEGPVTVTRGRSCLVLSHPDPDPLVAQVAEACEAAVPRVTSVWGPAWSRHVVLIVPSSVVELGRLVPQLGDLSQIAALATAELVSPTTGYHPVGDRVLLNPATFARLGGAGRRVVLTHEVTHVASRRLTGPAVPTWLVEGLADYVGYLGAGVPVRAAAQELALDVRAGRVPAALPTDDAFDASSSALPQVYEQSWLAVRLIVARYGVPGLLRLYRTAGQVPAGGSFDAALRSALGTSTAELTRQWRGALRSDLG